MIRFLLLGLVFISICSCTSAARNKLIVTKIEYRKADDVFKSKLKLFTRDMCGTDDIRTKISITAAQIEQIGDIAESSGFFDSSRKVVWPQQTCLDIGRDSSLTIVRGEKRNSMEWPSYCDGDFPSQLSETLKSLDQIIYNDKKVKNRPPANCPDL